MKLNAKRDYEHYKAKYNNTVPIRGREVSLRPVGDRKRVHEQITAKTLLSGEVSYCAKLHATDVVEYHANGWVTLRSGGWQTPSTADFMYMHSPFSVHKTYGKLWMYVRTPDGVKAYPVGNEITLRPVEHMYSPDIYEPINTVLIRRRVVDRAKAKAARDPMKAFLAWCKVFMAMSEGWVMDETFEAVRATTRAMDINYRTNRLYEYLCVGDPELYLELMCHMLRRASWGSAKVGAKQYSYDQVKSMAYKLAELHGDIYKIIEVEPTCKPMTDVV